MKPGTLPLTPSPVLGMAARQCGLVPVATRPSLLSMRVSFLIRRSGCAACSLILRLLVREGGREGKGRKEGGREGKLVGR